MTIFAEIKKGKVINVIVATQEIIDKNYTGTWVETKMDSSIRKQYAGIGMNYDKTKDKFILKSPFPSWKLDINDDWKSTIEKPIGFDIWDEENMTWK